MWLNRRVFFVCDEAHPGCASPPPGNGRSAWASPPARSSSRSLPWTPRWGWCRPPTPAPLHLSNRRVSVALDCYPSNPRGYFDLDLRDPERRREYEARRVRGLGDAWDRAPHAVELRFNSAPVPRRRVRSSPAGRAAGGRAGRLLHRGPGSEGDRHLPAPAGGAAEHGRARPVGGAELGPPRRRLPAALRDLRAAPGIRTGRRGVRDVPQRRRAVGRLPRAPRVRERMDVRPGRGPHGAGGRRPGLRVRAPRSPAPRAGDAALVPRRCTPSPTARAGSAPRPDCGTWTGGCASGAAGSWWPSGRCWSRAPPPTPWLRPTRPSPGPARPPAYAATTCATALSGPPAASLWVHPLDHHPNELAHRLAAESLAPAVMALSPGGPS